MHGAVVEDQCRSCRSTRLRPVLSLGKTPLANSLVTPERLGQAEAMYPLDLVFCADCALVQITVTVSPDELFRNYVYLSSYSDTMLAHAQRLTADVIRDRHLSDKSLVIEIASNDGYLLKNYLQAGIPALGVEPALNVAELAVERGIPTIAEFFGPELANRLADGGRQADVIHAHNVLAHVADLNGVVAGMARLVKPDGIVVVEAPYVRDMIDKTEFDTIYHEHLCYFSASSVVALFARHGLTVVGLDRVPIHGGSLRITAARTSSQSPGVRRLLDEEAALGLNALDYYATFGERVGKLREELVGTLRRLRPQGEIAAYGATAKGCTLLSYAGIGRETVEFVVDRNPLKQGLFTPGSHLPIVAPEMLVESMPAYVLLLAWNLADEVMQQQRQYRSSGGRFIIPVPEVQVV
jgi:SAM-dependent methyltransferase